MIYKKKNIIKENIKIKIRYKINNSNERNVCLLVGGICLKADKFLSNIKLRQCRVSFDNGVISRRK